MNHLYLKNGLKLSAILLAAFIVLHSSHIGEKKTGGALTTEQSKHTAFKPMNTQSSSIDTSHAGMSKIYSDLQQREYEITRDKVTGFYQSPNRSNNIRSYYHPGCWELQNRKSNEAGNWKLKFFTKGVYADGKEISVRTREPETKTDKSKIDFNYDGFTEEYVNTEEGVRQNFIINKNITETKELKVELAYNGMHGQEYGANALQFTNGKNKLTYSDLKAWDATGKTLNSHMQLNEKAQTLELVVDARQAIFPVTIDPIVANGTPSNANTLLESNQAASLFGTRVAGAGDVNSDGYSDVIIGAYLYDNGQIDEGAAFLYYGSSLGTSTSFFVLLEANQAYASFGQSVSGAGDVNGDGYSDIIVGATNYDNGQTDEGVAFIYHGSSTGINTTAAAIVESNQVNASLGYSVSCAGDVNGDGYSDVIAGAYLYDNGQTDEGVAFIYHGSSTGINIVAAALVESNQSSSLFGCTVSGAGDVNGDGYSDIIVGAYAFDNGQTDEGVAMIFNGSVSGISTTASSVLESNQISAGLGFSVSGAGDVNGDGYSDVIAGAYKYDNGQTDEGAAFIYQGSSSGVSIVATTIVESNQANALLGYSVSGIGDVDGDGYSDVIAGALQYSNGQTDEGNAFIYQGSSTGILSAIASRIESNQVGAALGCSVSGAGDVNGDGYSDVIVGVPYYDNGQTDEGTAVVFHGSASGISTTAAAMVESNQANAQLGNSVSGAGDVNGDGYSDVIIGAAYYDNGQTDEGVAFIYHGSATGISTTAAAMVESNQANAYFGISVSGSGDVNGDGYGDIIVGAYYYNNGQAYEGAAFIYHGSASGISTTAAAMVESNQVGARLGYSVSGAGDVNGDGYSDVIVGAYQYDNGQTDEGAAFVYHGSASGISTVAAAMVESNQATAYFGNSVSGAGDLNGDGYADVIVGAVYYDNGQTDEGAAFVYHGSASGISTSAAAIVESNQASGSLGMSVSCAGDVNGDGYSDVIVGANQYDNGQTNEGAAFIYHGSSTGINTAAATMVESNQASADFGISVSGAGDVNGDGYSDVVVGARIFDNGQTDEGVAFVYHGGVSGISTSAAEMVESNQSNANLGWSVSGAGDVNGDGFSDIVAGAPYYANGQSFEGSFFLFQGNSGGGLNRIVQLYNTSTTTLITQPNAAANDFRIGLLMKNPEGRTKAKLVWELKAQGQPFSNNPITNSTQMSGSQGSYTLLSVGGTRLFSDVNKVGVETKVRVRFKYDPVTSQNGEVYSPWIYPQGYFASHGMNAAPLPVVLTAFEATAVNNKMVKVSWETASEKNSNFFIVQRSKDGLQWAEVSRVKAAGNSLNAKFYSAEDEFPFDGQSYYRLIEVAMNGKESISEIRPVKIIDGKRNAIALFPNPTSTVINVTGLAEDLEGIEIYNAFGEVVTGKVQSKAGLNAVILDLSALPNGIYTIKTSRSAEIVVKR